MHPPVTVRLRVLDWSLLDVSCSKEKKIKMRIKEISLESDLHSF